MRNQNQNIGSGCQRLVDFHGRPALVFSLTVEFERVGFRMVQMLG